MRSFAYLLLLVCALLLLLPSLVSCAPIHLDPDRLEFFLRRPVGVVISPPDRIYAPSSREWAVNSYVEVEIIRGSISQWVTARVDRLTHDGVVVAFSRDELLKHRSFIDPGWLDTLVEFPRVLIAPMGTHIKDVPVAPKEVCNIRNNPVWYDHLMARRMQYNYDSKERVDDELTMVRNLPIVASVEVKSSHFWSIKMKDSSILHVKLPEATNCFRGVDVFRLCADDDTDGDFALVSKMTNHCTVASIIDSWYHGFLFMRSLGGFYYN